MLASHCRLLLIQVSSVWLTHFPSPHLWKDLWKSSQYSVAPAQLGCCLKENPEKTLTRSHGVHVERVPKGAAPESQPSGSQAK